MNGWTDLLEKLGGSPADFVMAAFIVILALYVVMRDRHCKEQIEKLEKRMDARFKSVNDRHTSTADKLWSEVNTVKGKYHQLDKLTAMLAIAIQRKTGLKLIKQSADGQGDHALNRDVE